MSATYLHCAKVIKVRAQKMCRVNVNDMQLNSSCEIVQRCWCTATYIKGSKCDTLPQHRMFAQMYTRDVYWSLIIVSFTHTVGNCKLM